MLPVPTCPIPTAPRAFLGLQGLWCGRPAGWGEGGKTPVLLSSPQPGSPEPKPNLPGTRLFYGHCMVPALAGANPTCECLILTVPPVL